MAKDIWPILRAEPRVTLLRGRRDGLEVTLSERNLEEACDELKARLAEQPSFYRGSSAVANFGATLPSAEALTRVRAVLDDAGVRLRALSGWGEGFEGLAEAEGLAFEPLPPPIRLSDSARSLVADFAGARDDIAKRRSRGDTSVPRIKREIKAPRGAPALHLVEPGPTTFDHAATLRGGQVLHHTGNIVVVGDVNPGAELVATGDILVFGRLAGIAHAGAGGDAQARIYALDLKATQLRIATFIAAEQESKRQRHTGPRPEAALARDGRILILPLDRLNELEGTGTSSA